MDFIAQVKSKYPHLATEDATSLVDKAKMFYYGFQYPCEPFAEETEKPIITFVGQRWILAACDEMVERLGFNSAIGYRENGVTWTFDGAELSDRLVSLIKPTIGVLK